MRGIRRRDLAPDLAAAYAAFQRCAEHVDLAQRAMIRCVPSSPRSLPLPLEVGAETLEVSLAAARAELAGWRHPQVEAEWQTCAAALTETAAGVSGAVAVAAGTSELEVALTAVQDLLDPLHAFVDAERRFADLRRGR
ncbi:MAG TPA: hypothetical protein VNA12_00720 [Mycobacteriales bacterium]|nr:hypothetical protein [Mycobacteriales bacterium]